MDGVILVNKPSGFTSFDVVAKMRGITKERKIGHTGTLDPMATGVLPLLLGRAAKAADILPNTQKRYLAAFALGKQTDTGDVTGKIKRTDSASVSKQALIDALGMFRGEIMQIPPMYSAVSIGGKRLYELAREGKEIEREARRIEIFHLELIHYDEETRQGELEAFCSQGVYIRTLIEDIAEQVGSCGVMTGLCRTYACGFSLNDCKRLEEIQTIAMHGKLDAVIKPTERLFEGLPQIVVSPAQARRFQNGGRLSVDRLRICAEAMQYRVKGPDSRFLGIGELNAQRSELCVKKLFVLSGE